MRTFLKLKKEKAPTSAASSLKGESADEEDEFHDTADVSDLCGLQILVLRCKGQKER